MVGGESHRVSVGAVAQSRCVALIYRSFCDGQAGQIPALTRNRRSYAEASTSRKTNAKVCGSKSVETTGGAGSLIRLRPFAHHARGATEGLRCLMVRTTGGLLIERRQSWHKQGPDHFSDIHQKCWLSQRCLARSRSPRSQPWHRQLRQHKLILMSPPGGWQGSTQTVHCLTADRRTAE